MRREGASRAADAGASTLAPPRYGIGFVDRLAAGAVVQRKVPDEAESESIREPARPAPKDALGVLPPEGKDPEAIAAKVTAAEKQIEQAIRRSEDTLELDQELQRIKDELGLKAIWMADLGTPRASVQFEVNPRGLVTIPSGEVVYRMVGTYSPKPITQVDWHKADLTVGAQKAEVGVHMIANPLAPDHEPGSLSTDDSAQDAMMKELANAGTTSVANDKKYIKGHLLNDHVGGPGHAYNLFPITADANAKHLAYIEKYVKAQLAGHYVIQYEVKVAFLKPVAQGMKYSIDAEFQFFWQLLDTSGQGIKAKHTGTIQSIFNTKGAPPFDVTTEYTGEYDKLNKGKGTPKAIGQASQWQTPYGSPAMQSTPFPTISMAYTPLTSMLGWGGSAAPAVAADYTGVGVKTDSSGVEYISVRNSDVTVNVNSQMLVSTSASPVTVKAVSLMGGGWTRIYF